MTADGSSSEHEPTGPESSHEISGASSAEAMPPSEFSKGQLLTNTADALEGAPFRFSTPNFMFRGKTAELGNGMKMEIIGQYDVVGILQQTGIVAEQTGSDGSLDKSYISIAKGPDGMHSVERSVFHQKPGEQPAQPNLSENGAIMLKMVHDRAKQNDPEGAPSAYDLSSRNTYDRQLDLDDLDAVIDSLKQPQGNSVDLSEAEVQAINRLVKGINWRAK